jgi:hypothetical protein
VDEDKLVAEARLSVEQVLVNVTKPPWPATWQCSLDECRIYEAFTVKEFFQQVMETFKAPCHRTMLAATS